MFFFFGYFACKTASTMHPIRNCFGDAVAVGAGSTGQTVNAAFALLERKQPPFVVLESVVAFADLSTLTAKPTISQDNAATTSICCLNN